MVKLEDIAKGSQISGIQGDELVTVFQTELVGDSALTIYYKDSDGKLGEQMLFRSDESRLTMTESRKSWGFDAPGAEFKLGLEAYRISQAALFDPMMAVHTSNIEPLPHQISAVYESMLPRQPLRFVLADDPGAGKTIMAGLLISELLMRADAKRILVVAPGSLTEQWQDELSEKFGLHFDLFSRDKQEQCISGNYFDEASQLICRIDQLSRNEDYQAKLKNTSWDIIIVDEAHKLSANYYGLKLKKTKRFELGELLGSITRHFLLMTATPHNGKEEDFQAWLSLLDSDRFYGKFRGKVHKIDISDMMRRMIKEELIKFDGTKLLPARLAYTANYHLSDLETELYEAVTAYVREEMNRADRLTGQKKNTVGFALTQLQRRLASSPRAIYQSLKGRRERLEAELEEKKSPDRGQLSQKQGIAETLAEHGFKKQNLPEDFDDIDDELSAKEYEAYVDWAVIQSTAAETIPELEAEIVILRALEQRSHDVLRSGNDKKWEQLSTLIQEEPAMRAMSKNGYRDSRKKLIIFTEHKATLHYLVDQIGDLLGSHAVRAIHGGVNRDERRKIQEEFRNVPEVLVLVATDAAGEGVNLQNANLMVNYDLPWNPNRLEQRFGRIHRIGQTEVCHLWNIVANETREGEVFKKLFDKIEVQREALGDKVFDVLGQVFHNVPLKELLMNAIRYGDDPATSDKTKEAIDSALDHDHIIDLVNRNALVKQHMGLKFLYVIKEEMEKAEARKLQPYFIRAFFTEAFTSLRGELRSRESGRFEVKNVPLEIRERNRKIGETRTPVLKKYERICFEKGHIRHTGKPMADMIHPVHPLMHATTDLVLQAHRQKLKRGAVLVNPNDDSTTAKVLFMIDHTVREAGSDGTVASRRLQFVEIDEVGGATNAGWAPHLDLQPIDDADKNLASDVLAMNWLNANLEALALEHASQKLVPEHYNEIRGRRERQADKTLKAVHERLVKEIDYSQDRCIKFEDDVKTGKRPPVQLEKARRQVEELAARLEQRTAELKALKEVVSSTPVVIGGALVIPQGLLANRKGETQFAVDAESRAHIEHIAITAVMDTERKLGYEVTDVGAEKCGWDITSRPPVGENGVIKDDRHIEVKGRSKGQTTITVSRNEIIYGLNQSDKFILAIVIVDGDQHEGPFYIKNPFTVEPDFGVASINYELSELLSKAVEPEKTI